MPKIINSKTKFSSFGPSNNNRARPKGQMGVKLGMMCDDSDEDQKHKPALISQIFQKKTSEPAAKPTTLMAMFAHANKQNAVLKARPLEKKEDAIAIKRILEEKRKTPETDIFNKYKMGGEVSKEIKE